MREAVTARDVVATNGAVTLAGSFWLPRSEARAGVVMFPGSGASDRHNDVVFPPIRDHLVGHGIVVASFDKRGVGRSGGDWRTVGLDVLADDALAQMAAIKDLDAVPPERLGLFGHSQGGWVVIEAAARDRTVAFVVTHSGPGVGVADQDRFAVSTALMGTGASAIEIRAALDLYLRGMDNLREEGNWEDFARRLSDPSVAGQVALLERAGYSWPSVDERLLLGLILDHEPALAMRQIDCPVLALFGADDALVPVNPSVDAFERELGSRGLLKSVVVPGADHRMRVGDPPTLASDYLETMADWILGVTSGEATRR